jgi:outer membrane beta-barrel protein
MKWLFHVLLLSLIPICVAHAEEVEFPEEELARESVLPVFENPQDVLHRNVNTNERFELGVGGGLDIDEPFYDDVIYSLHGGYHFTNQHAFNVDALIWSTGLSSYGSQLRTNESIGYWDPSKAPHASWGLMGNYEFTAYYGKISIAKQAVMNLNLFVFGGPLYINMKNYNSYGLDLGLGQNFFITPSFSIRFDFRELMFEGPNAAAANLQLGSNPSSYPTTTFFYNQVELLLVFLL